MSQTERDAFFDIIKDSVQLLNVAYLWNVPVDEQWRMSYRELMERINELTGRPDETPAQEPRGDGNLPDPKMWLLENVGAVPDGEDEREKWHIKLGVLTHYKIDAERLASPARTEGLREAIRGRLRLYDSQVDPDCIGTGYDVTDIITMTELEQLVDYERAAHPPQQGETP
jgi:hypothetical protein